MIEKEPPDPVVTKQQYTGANVSSQHHHYTHIIPTTTDSTAPVHSSLAVIVENKLATTSARKLPTYGESTLAAGTKVAKKRPPTPTPTPQGASQFPISIRNSPNVTVQVDERSNSRPAPMSKTNPSSLVATDANTLGGTVKRTNKFMLKKRSSSVNRPSTAVSNVAPTAVDSPPVDLIANGRAEVRKLVDRRLMVKSDTESGSSGSEDKSGLKLPSTLRKTSASGLAAKPLQFQPIRKSSASQTPRQREFTVV